MLDFNEFEKELNGLTAKDKLNLILSKIYECNNVSDLENTRVIIGTIEKDLDDGYYQVGNLYSVLGDALTSNPFTDKTLEMRVPYSTLDDPASEGNNVVFSVQNNLSVSPEDLLLGTNLYTFQKLGISTETSVEERLQKIIQIKPFTNRLKNVDTIWKTRQRSHSEHNDSHHDISNQGDIMDLSHQDSVSTEDPTKDNLDIIKQLQLSSFLTRLDFKYNPNNVRCFLMALGTNQIITLFGAPGTGKTTFVRKMAKALGAKYHIISVQNNWTDSSDLLGYYSPINRTYESTPFLEALLAAKADWNLKGDQSPLHIICLDEMNLARIEYYFAIFLSMLQLDPEEQIIHLLPKYLQSELDTFSEKDEIPTGKEYLTLLREYSNFQMPRNVRFVGTMNNDDTTTILSPKVIDRSFFIEMTNDDFSEYNLTQPVGYYPCSLFTSSDLPFIYGDEYFHKENSRFKKYAAQMGNIYINMISKDNSSKVNYTDFYEDLIIGKILPALKTARFDYDTTLFPRAYDAYLRRQPIGDSYNYLGGF